MANLGRSYGKKEVDEVIEAATELARHRIGALIAFEQEANLDEFVGTHRGHVVDAAVTRELLVSLFVPEGINKLHDGAVIIRNLRIAKAGVFFPMPEQRVVDSSFGSRHRAALGITEETDAVVVVVSEERGNISFCFNGNIASNLDGPKLRTMLEAVFSPKSVRKRAARRAAATSTPLPLPAPESRRDVDETPAVAMRTEATPLNFARIRANPEPEGPASVRPKPLVEIAEDTLRTRVKESDPPRARKVADSDHPTPLRTRPGIDDLLPRIPKPAKVPVLLPRVAMPARGGEQLNTPTGTDAAVTPALPADGHANGAKELLSGDAARSKKIESGAGNGGDKS